MLTFYFFRTPLVFQRSWKRGVQHKRKLLILLDHRRSQENMESRQNHFWYAFIAQPFPPLPPPIQCLPGLLYYIILLWYVRHTI